MRSSGFTLTELLVVISIIIILTSVSLPVYQGARGQLALRRAANKLAQDIGRAREMAISVEEYSGTIPPGGYGVYFEATPWPLTPSSEYNFYIYADNSGNRRYDSGEQIEKISLEKGTKIKKVGSGSQRYSINFTPPDPGVSFYEGGIQLAQKELEIIISLKKDPSMTKSVIVNKSGLLYVK